MSSVIVPSYAYAYVKVAFLGKLIMDKDTLEALRGASDLEQLMNIIAPYFPGIEIKETKIEEIEKAITQNYIKMIGKIISFSPENMREFLRDFLLQYEVSNIKHSILGSIIGMRSQEKSNYINFLAEEYLDNREFIEDLIEINSLDEIQLFMRETRYNRVIREGISYFRNNNEVFVLESFLDQLYYRNLTKNYRRYEKTEKQMIGLFIKYRVELYNINMIYRGIMNNVDKKLLSQFLVDEYLFLNEELRTNLLQKDTLDTFFTLLNEFYKKEEDLKKNYKPIEKDTRHPIWELEKLYQTYFFEKYQHRVAEIDYAAIYQIMELLIKKEREIKFEIIPKAVDIIQQKYRILQ
ncbi:MAG: V-type ATP synthase subunit C [Promethearchaeota archaeon]|nr:MAG: V-type ATP synthase subunit C [Candidatus Lokiarchaeota archaeon]